jgi:hypothetical protein
MYVVPDSRDLATVVRKVAPLRPTGLVMIEFEHWRHRPIGGLVAFWPREPRGGYYDQETLRMSLASLLILSRLHSPIAPPFRVLFLQFALDLDSAIYS